MEHVVITGDVIGFGKLTIITNEWQLNVA